MDLCCVVLETHCPIVSIFWFWLLPSSTTFQSNKWYRIGIRFGHILCFALCCGAVWTHQRVRLICSTQDFQMCMIAFSGPWCEPSLAGQQGFIGLRCTKQTLSNGVSPIQYGYTNESSCCFRRPISRLVHDSFGYSSRHCCTTYSNY